MQTIEGVEYLDVDEAAGLLGVKKATLYAYVSRGLLHSFRQSVGRRRLYRRSDIEALREVRPSDEAPAASPSAPAPALEPHLPAFADDDRVQRDVTLPDAASWAGEH